MYCDVGRRRGRRPSSARAHRALRAFAVRRRLREVIGVARRAVADDLARRSSRRAPARARAPRGSRRRRPRPSRSRRASRRTAATPSAGRSLRSDSAFMFAKPPIAIGVTVASEPPVIMTSASPYWMVRIRVADRVGAGGAGRHGRVVRALGVEAHRDDAGRDVGDEHRDEERADLARPALAIDVVLLLEALEAADAAADDDAGPVGIVVAPSSSPASRHRLRPTRRPRTACTGRPAWLPCDPCTAADRSPSPRRRSAPGNVGRVELRDRRRARTRRRAAHARSSPRRCRLA